MKANRNLLIDYLNDEIKKGLTDRNTFTKRIKWLYERYNVPMSLVSDYISMRSDIKDASDRILFYLLEIVDNSSIKSFFTDSEIEEYEIEYHEENVKFPIKWNMIEVNPDQWIGMITVKELMLLKQDQLIRYNENTQRTLRRVVNKDYEYYQIALNRTQVNEIIDSYSNDSYISNTITLNIPEDAEFKFSDGKLIINKLNAFDILDGYHRYIAMSNIYNINPDFDYNMELRVVCFPTEKAQQFIWQEDQKTKMSKIDSNSFNQNDPANQVINLINQTSLFHNIIGRNSGIIDAGLASALIDNLYFDTRKVITRSKIIEVKNSILSKMNIIIDEAPAIFDIKWNRHFTIAAFIVMHEIENDHNLVEDIYKLNRKIDSSDSPEILVGGNGTAIGTTIVNRVKKLYKEV